MRIKTWMVAAFAVVGVLSVACGGGAPGDGSAAGAAGESIEELIEEIKALHAERRAQEERSAEGAWPTGSTPAQRMRERVQREVSHAALEEALDAALVSGEWEDVRDRTLLMFLPADAAPVEIVTAVRDNVSEAVEFTRFTRLRGAVMALEMQHRNYAAWIEDETELRAVLTAQAELEDRVDAAIEAGKWGELAAAYGLPVDAPALTVLETIAGEIEERNRAFQAAAYAR